MTDFSIIIPNRNSVASLRLTINSIINDSLLLSSNYEIIVANDGAQEDVKNHIIELKKNGLNITEVVIEKSNGSYFARNRAINKSSGVWIIFFDAGLIVSKDWFKKLQPYLQKFDYLGGDVIILFKEKMTLGEKFDFLYAFPMRKYMEQYHFGGAGYLIIKRGVFNKVGLFNEKLYSGGDGEFGVRVLNAGYRQGFFPEAPAYHEPRNFKKQFKKKIRQIKGHYDLYLFKKNGTNPLKFNYLAHAISPFKKTLYETRRYIKNQNYRKIVPLLPFIFGSFVYNTINVIARIYVRLNKNKIINT